nr:retrovirus-related Pol polyprotein from transposon TNT 1-94 [Tanacetum cinerariifolium]
RLNNHTPEVEEDQTDQEDGDEEDACDQEIDQPPDLTDYQLARDREPRTRTKPLRFRDESNMVAYMFVATEKKDTHEPLTYQKIKEGIEGVQKPRYKAGLVAHAFTQRASIDYIKVFSLVVRHTSIRVILALTSPRQWYRRFDEYMLSNRFKRNSYDSCVYYRIYAPGEYIYLLLYVDDMLIACKSKDEIWSTKSLLKKEFDMKELGDAKKILGTEIVRDQSRKILRVSQSGYVSKILNNFRINNGKSVKMPLGGHFKLSLKDCSVRDCDVERMSKVPYANAVGSLMYLMVCTRPDIAYAVSVVSRYLANPGKNHWEAVKWILKYLRGIANVGLVYGTDRDNHVDVTGFVDSDYAKDLDKEAEYMALMEAVKEAIWLRKLLEELGIELNTVAVNCDNQGAIHLSRNHVFHEMTKYINVHYHFIREVLEVKTVKVLKVGTEHNVADALTKVVPGLKLQHCLELLNLRSSNRVVGDRIPTWTDLHWCRARATPNFKSQTTMWQPTLEWYPPLIAPITKRTGAVQDLYSVEIMTDWVNAGRYVNSDFLIDTDARNVANPVTGGCLQVEVSYDEFTVNLSNGRNILAGVYGASLIAGCAPSSALVSFPKNVTGVMALSRSPYAYPAQVTGIRKNILALCLPSTTSARGVLLFGESPFYLLPHSDVDITRKDISADEGAHPAIRDAPYTPAKIFLPLLRFTVNSS